MAGRRNKGSRRQVTIAAKGRERTVPLTKGGVDKCTSSKRNPVGTRCVSLGCSSNIINLEVQEEPRVSCFELTPCPEYERRIDANLTRQPSCKEAERTLFINQ